MAGQFYVKRLKGMLDPEKFEHSLGVRDTAVRLARINGVDEERAALAGLLHDCARCLPEDRILEMAGRFAIPHTEVEMALPVLLHAPLGAELARREFGVSDQAVLRAISVHTLGDADMAMLDKVVFVADKAEPGRRFSGVEEIRRKMCADLDRALLACYDLSIGFALQNGAPVHPTMIEARNRLVLSGPGRKF
ncbi:MAG: bis(5'-nucleosyl)-tetraphosphatase (symmetrical) YqeK [Firmicutes bacterium]|nr:bis(5'-nucleosyl)-tetraphosphatase (symmetrical) YqeK [Bacillota bacterium]